MSEAIYKIREQTIKEIADAIRAKANKTDLISPLDMPEEILMLQSGSVDFTQQTVTAEKVLAGDTFFDNHGLIATGTMPNNGAISQSLAINGTYTIPAGYHNGSGKVTQNLTTKAATTYGAKTSDQTISAGQYLSGAQTIKKVEQSGLTAANIVKGKTITIASNGSNLWSVTGTAETSELNFKVVGGITQPTNPVENTIWVNTDLEITGWGFDTEPAEYLTTGGVWIKTGTNGNVEFNALKKNGICIYPQSCMQWDGTKYVSKDVKVYKNGEWLALKIWFLQGGEQYRDATGGWAVIDTPNGAHQPATIDGDGITFLTTSHTYREIATVSPVDFTNINTLYFSVPRISLSGGDYRRFSMGINSTRTHKLVNNSDPEGWLVEKFIQNPHPAANLLYSLDTSSVNTECYILAVTGCGGGTTLTVVINEIYGV